MAITEEELESMMAGRHFSVGHNYAPEIERLVAEVRRLQTFEAAMRAGFPDCPLHAETLDTIMAMGPRTLTLNFTGARCPTACPWVAR